MPSVAVAVGLGLALSLVLFFRRGKREATDERGKRLVPTSEGLAAGWFILRIVGELLVILRERFWANVGTMFSRYCRCLVAYVPGSLDGAPDLAWLQRTLSNTQIDAGVLRSAEATTATPLAEDEGFTSALWRIEIFGPGNDAASATTIVVKQTPSWSTFEQVTSLVQQQHSKEKWVADHWTSIGCLVPEMYASHISTWTGEFCHVMAWVGDTHVAGDQLESLAVDLACAAVEEVARLHAKFWGAVDGNSKLPSWDESFDGLDRNMHLLVGLSHNAAKDPLPDACTRFVENDPPFIRALERFLARGGRPGAPRTVIHGDLRSANVMFPRNSGKDRCMLIDWGGLMRGQGVFDVAYLLGTGMSASDREQHEERVLVCYLESLRKHGAATMYSMEELREDYRSCLWLAAALYALPGIYDRGTTTDANAAAAAAVKVALRRNLQPILDAGYLAAN